VSQVFFVLEQKQLSLAPWAEDGSRLWSS